VRALAFQLWFQSVGEWWLTGTHIWPVVVYVCFDAAFTGQQLAILYTPYRDRCCATDMPIMFIDPGDILIE